MTLFDQAAAQLERWGLTIADAEDAGLYPVESVKAIFPDMAAEPAIVIPYFNPDGTARRYRDVAGQERSFARVRWLVPTKNTASAFLKPKARRYDQPAKSGVHVYFPPTAAVDWEAVIANPKTAIVITEGEAKAICACRLGIPTIALGGVYSFMARSAAELLPELEAIPWRDRDVYVVFDSDAATNPQVMAAEGRLADELQRVRGAKLRIVRLPASEGGGKVGLDDFLSMPNGLQSFNNLCRMASAVNLLDIKILGLNSLVAWVEKEGGVYDTAQKMFIQKANFICGSHHSSNKHVIAGQRASRTVIVSQEWLTHPLARRFTEILFRPGEGRTVVGSTGAQALNIWDGFQHETPGDVEPFLELTRHAFSMLPPATRGLPLQLLAYKAQHPEQKIPLSIVMVGPAGSGKSLWGEIICEAFEGYGKAISAEQMVGKFNGSWAETCLVAVVDEADEATVKMNREKIKAMISQKRIMMEEKFRSQREINSYGFFIFNSNKRAVGSYDYDDRRMIVADIPPKREPEFYDKVVAWRKAGGAHWLMNYLLTWDLGTWRPPAQAPESAEKLIAYAEGLSPIAKLADEMRHHGGENTILQWIQAAQAAAAQMESSPNSAIAAQGRAITAKIPSFQIKPFYTAAELVMLFPLVLMQGSNFKGPPTPGELSRYLREAGIFYLQCIDNPRGFMVKGRVEQFLVIADFDRWKEPITQAQFDAAGPWRTYSDIARAMRR